MISARQGQMRGQRVLLACEADLRGTGDSCRLVLRAEVPAHNPHAALVHQLGVGQERLTLRHRGCDYRLTDVHGKVLRPLLS